MPQKKCEGGWMYHAKGNPRCDPKPAPPLSSIPLIGLQPEDPNEPVRNRSFSNLRLTDTPLIRLQKMGGRKDLLCFHESEPLKDSVEVPSECASNSPRYNMPSCSEGLVNAPAYVHHAACTTKSPVHPTPTTVDSPCQPLPKTELPRQRRIKPWNQPSSRPGYSKYNKAVPPLSFIRREYFYPHNISYVRVSYFHLLPATSLILTRELRAVSLEGLFYPRHLLR
ncbi:hypothetical protein TcWFU_002081 [Taenia crassiceps]|uniref:Uncharacterized protein n=1 Tax=Taenia crassiceps TaxID=6207 RepID=A0ABR4Q8P9_9CEST